MTNTSAEREESFFNYPIKNLFGSLVSRYITHSDRSSEDERQFEQYATNLLSSTTEGMAWGFLFVILMTWPPQFIYWDDWNRIVQLSYWRIFASSFLIIYLFGIYATDWINDNVRKFFIFGCLIIFFIIGFFVGRLDELNYLFTYSYFIPFVIVLYPSKILVRTALTFLLTISFVIGYLISYPTLLGSPAIHQRMVILLSMICLCIILGHMYFHLLRQDFFRRKELQEKNKQLEYLSTHDSITGLYNASIFEERIEEEFSRARRHKLNISLLLMKIDNYEVIKIRDGLDSLNQLLEEIGNVFDRHTRQSDIASRYAEDTFCMILPETSKEEGKHLLKRLRQDLNNFLDDSSDNNVVPQLKFSLHEKTSSTGKPNELIENALKSME